MTRTHFLEAVKSEQISKKDFSLRDNNPIFNQTPFHNIRFFFSFAHRSLSVTLSSSNIFAFPLLPLFNPFPLSIHLSFHNFTSSSSSSSSFHLHFSTHIILSLSFYLFYYNYISFIYTIFHVIISKRACSTI